MQRISISTAPQGTQPAVPEEPWGLERSGDTAARLCCAPAGLGTRWYHTAHKLHSGWKIHEKVPVAGPVGCGGDRLRHRART